MLYTSFRFFAISMNEFCKLIIRSHLMELISTSLCFSLIVGVQPFGAKATHSFLFWKFWKLNFKASERSGEKSKLTMYSRSMPKTMWNILILGSPKLTNIHIWVCMQIFGASRLCQIFHFFPEHRPHSISHWKYSHLYFSQSVTGSFFIEFIEAMKLSFQSFKLLGARTTCSLGSSLSATTRFASLVRS
jgi:hypothetical protein